MMCCQTGVTKRGKVSGDVRPAAVLCQCPATHTALLEHTAISHHQSASCLNNKYSKLLSTAAVRWDNWFRETNLLLLLLSTAAVRWDNWFRETNLLLLLLLLLKGGRQLSGRKAG
jgi:hypothetical protein